MTPAKFGRRLRICRERGLARTARIYLDTAALSLLRLLFGFHPWHARSPASLRSYRKGVAELISGLQPRCVVEVGCGLGAILSRVRAPERTGYDVDRGAIKAAQFVHGRSMRFIEGSFAEIMEPVIDVLIVVNWPHDFPPDQLERWIVPLLPRVAFLLLDRVEPNSPLTYRYYHDFAFLDGRVKLLCEETYGEDHRRFVLFQVIG